MKSEALPSLLSRLLGSPAAQFAVLLGLCSAYIQGAATKIVDFPGALAEMEHFGLRPAVVFAVLVIVLELAASVMILSGFRRWIGALLLAGFTLAATFVALRFWQMPSGMVRTMAMNAFFEHLGLCAAFLLVAGMDLAERKGR